MVVRRVGTCVREWRHELVLELRMGADGDLEVSASMADPSFDRIMAGQQTFLGDELTPTSGGQILAVDTNEQWGAAFRFSLCGGGEWHVDCFLAHRADDGHWENLGSAGEHGGGWPTPWRAPEDGYDGTHLMVMGWTSQSAADEEDVMAVYGFASRQVDSIIVQHNGVERTVPVSRIGAFVAVGPGNGAMTLVPVTLSGQPLSAPEVVERT